MSVRSRYKEFEVNEMLFEDPIYHTPSWTYTTKIRGIEDLLESHNHDMRALKAGGRGDIGGNFHTVKHSYDGGPDNRASFYPGDGSIVTTSQYAYIADVYPWQYREIGSLPLADLQDLGQGVLSSMLPTSPKVNVTAMIGELLADGGLPSPSELNFMQERAYRAKQAGKDFLAAEFAWAPLLGDCQKLVNTINNKQKIIDAFIENAGKRITRKYAFPIEKSVSKDDSRRYPTPHNMITNNHYAGEGYLTHTHTIREERWVEAVFTYSLPSALNEWQSFQRSRQISNHLFGTEITPDTLWSIAPWSWAVDWFVGVSPFIKIFTETQFNGLVIEYAYIMEKVTSIDRFDLIQTYAQSDPPTHTVGSASRHFYQQFTVESKRRHAIGQFQIGWTFDGLSPVQALTAAALGFTGGGSRSTG